MCRYSGRFISVPIKKDSGLGDFPIPDFLFGDVDSSFSLAKRLFYPDLVILQTTDFPDIDAEYDLPGETDFSSYRIVKFIFDDSFT